MRSEIHPDVLDHIDALNAAKGPIDLEGIANKLGRPVRDLKADPHAYVFKHLAGGRGFLTFWGEFIHVHLVLTHRSRKFIARRLRRRQSAQGSAHHRPAG